MINLENLLLVTGICGLGMEVVWGVRTIVRYSRTVRDNKKKWEE